MLLKLTLGFGDITQQLRRILLCLLDFYELLCCCCVRGVYLCGIPRDSLRVVLMDLESETYSFTYKLLTGALSSEVGPIPMVKLSLHNLC